MTKEDKRLLLQDLCARLPYGIIGRYSWKGNKPYNRELTGSLFDELKSSWYSTEDSKFLPYLRPMSSMTEEERIEYEQITHWGSLTTFMDWLNKKMFDYRGLIPKDLALSTEVFNPYKD